MNLKAKWGIWCEPTYRTKNWAPCWGACNETWQSKAEAEAVIDGFDDWQWEYWTFSVKKYSQRSD